MKNNTRKFRQSRHNNCARYHARRIFVAYKELCRQYLTTDLCANFGKVIMCIMYEAHERQFIRCEFTIIFNVLMAQKRIIIFDHSRILTDYAPKNSGIVLTAKIISHHKLIICDNNHAPREIILFTEFIDLLTAKYKTLEVKDGNCIVTL